MKALAAALVEAQKEMPAVIADSVNPHFNSRFVSLDHLIAKTKPVLTKHGLAIVQMPAETATGAPGLKTILMHTSGESTESVLPLVLDGQNMQKLGGALTYARRYSWAAALGICDETDDDGNSASAPGTGANASTASASARGEASSGTGESGVGGRAAGSSSTPPSSPAAPKTDVQFTDGEFTSPPVPAIGNGYGLAAEIDASPGGGEKYKGKQVRDLTAGQLKWIAGLWAPEGKDHWRPKNQAQQLLKRAVTAYMEDKNATVQLAEPDENDSFYASVGDADSGIPFRATVDGLGN